MKWATALNLADHRDWRLPTADELVFLSNSISLANFKSIFPYTESDYYWSSTMDTYGPDYAWGVYFSNGRAYSNNKYDSMYVRCVRGGQ